MKLPHHSKTGYDQETVILPAESVGACHNATRCRNFATDLANGYCVNCWDRGLDKQRRNNTDRPVRRRKPNGQYNFGERSYSVSWRNGRHKRRTEQTQQDIGTMGKPSGRPS